MNSQRFSIRFRPGQPALAVQGIFDKQRLWCRRLPQFQLVEAADRWSTLVTEGGNVDALSGKADCPRPTFALAAITARSYTGESEKRHRIGFSRPKVAIRHYRPNRAEFRQDGQKAKKGKDGSAFQ